MKVFGFEPCSGLIKFCSLSVVSPSSVLALRSPDLYISFPFNAILVPKSMNCTTAAATPKAETGSMFRKLAISLRETMSKSSKSTKEKWGCSCGSRLTPWRLKMVTAKMQMNTSSYLEWIESHDICQSRHANHCPGWQIYANMHAAYISSNQSLSRLFDSLSTQWMAEGICVDDILLWGRNLLLPSFHTLLLMTYSQVLWTSLVTTINADCNLLIQYFYRLSRRVKEFRAN